MTEQKIMDFARAEFEWLHAHPELAYEEFETTARLHAAFGHAGILDVPLQTGLVAAIGTGAKPIVALRTDIDALPVHEETRLPYASQYDGKMHACGHDFHMASVLAAALLLKETAIAADFAPMFASLLEDASLRQTLSQNFKQLARPRATEEIVDLMIKS